MVGTGGPGIPKAASLQPEFSQLKQPDAKGSGSNLRCDEKRRENPELRRLTGAADRICGLAETMCGISQPNELLFHHLGTFFLSQDRQTCLMRQPVKSATKGETLLSNILCLICNHFMRRSTRLTLAKRF